jgi:tRNA threonylcarbamoyladenosine biosynthesis protein TsaB
LALILNLETATGICAVAVSVDGIPIARREAAEEKSHATKLTLLIDECLKASGVDYHQLDAVAVSNGPGSYTGLRIGLATAKGLCYAIDKPLIVVNTLEAMAAGWFLNNPEKTDVLACPMIDARRMEVYTAVYDKSFTAILPVQAMVVDENSFAEVLEKNAVCFFGDGMSKCRELLKGNQSAFFDATAATTAAGVAARSEYYYQSGCFEDLTTAGPFYLKEFRTTSQKKGMV